MADERVKIHIEFEATVSNVEQYDGGIEGWAEGLQDELVNELNSNWCQTESSVTLTITR